MTDQHDGSGVDRRGFLQTTAALAAGGALLFGDWSEAAAQGTRLPTRELGRTGLKPSTVSFGGIQLSAAAHRRVLEHAIDQGMNLVHTCPGYTNGQSIRIVGEVMKTRREKVILAVKTDPSDVDNCLRLLNTDHIDILCPHRAHNGLGSQDDHAAFARMKQAGKIRFTGFATHDNQAAALQGATRAGAWDTVLVGYNVGNRADLNPVIAEAVRRQRMGFMVMKSAQFPGDKTAARFQANIRTLLGNGNIHTLCIGLSSVQHVDQCIAAVLQRTTAADLEFEREVAACAGRMCSLCGRCQEVCPQGVAVTELLRADLYRGRGDVTLARELLAGLPARRSVAACDACGRCNQACQRGIDVMRTIREVAAV